MSSLNLVTMNPTEALESAVMFYKMNQPFMLHGDPGAGKTATIEGLCKDSTALVGIHLNLITANLSMMEPVDMRGLPHDDGMQTIWRKPNWLPQIDRDGPNGILFFDECNTARGMFPTLMQVFLARQCGEHRILPGWLPVAAGNYRSAKGVACDMPAPFNNRVAHFDYQPCWRFFSGELAAKIGLHPLVVAYVRYRPDMLSIMPGKKPDQTHIPAIPADARAFPTCRAWEAISNLLKQNPSDRLRQRQIASLIGPEVAADFESFYLVARDVTPIADIVANPETAPVPTQIGLLHAVTSALANYATRDNFAAIIRYGKRLADAGQREFYVVLGTDATRRNPDLKTTGAYTTWIADNPDLLT